MVYAVSPRCLFFRVCDCWFSFHSSRHCCARVHLCPCPVPWLLLVCASCRPCFLMRGSCSAPLRLPLFVIFCCFFVRALSYFHRRRRAGLPGPRPSFAHEPGLKFEPCPFCARCASILLLAPLLGLLPVPVSAIFALCASLGSFLPPHPGIPAEPSLLNSRPARLSSPLHIFDAIARCFASMCVSGHAAFVVFLCCCRSGVGLRVCCSLSPTGSRIFPILTSPILCLSFSVSPFFCMS